MKPTKQIILPVIIILLSLSMQTFSQTTYLTPLLNAVTTNFNYGESNNELADYKKNSSGLLIGASFQKGITPKFSVVTELYGIMRKGQLKSNNPLNTYSSKVWLYNMEIPVLGRVHFGKFYINSGPYAAYTVSGKIKSENTESNTLESKSISFDGSEKSFRRWDAGIQAGAGYNFHIKKSAMVLDVRYGYGLVNISKDVERYNRMLNISVLMIMPWKNN